VSRSSRGPLTLYYDRAILKEAGRVSTFKDGPSAPLTTRESAYAVVLAYAKRRLGNMTRWRRDAAAVGLSLAEFTDLVGREWAVRQCTGIGHVPASWRIERCSTTSPCPPVAGGSTSSTPTASPPPKLRSKVNSPPATWQRHRRCPAWREPPHHHHRVPLGPQPVPGRRHHSPGPHLLQQARHRALLGLLAHRRTPTRVGVRRGFPDHRH